MPLMQVSRPLARKSAILAMAAALCLGGCTVGPDYHKPTAVAPADWTSWHSGSDALRPALADAAPLPPDWWQGFRDPVLDELERRAFTASPDLRTAALHFAQARVQRDVTASQGLPQVNATATVQGQRQSEFGASTRLFDEIGGANRDALAKLLGEPYTLYKGGFDASWEIDFWGKVRRSVEAANADIAQQGALLDQARLTLASDVAQAYFSLRSAQRDLAMARADIDDLRERTRILAERTKGGLANHFDLERQHIDLRFAEAQLPALEAQEASQINRIALLLGDRPGSLSDLLHPQESEAAGALPIWRSACRRRSPCAVPTFAPPKPACTRRPQRSASRAPISIPRSSWAGISTSNPIAPATCSNGAAIRGALARASICPCSTARGADAPSACANWNRRKRPFPSNRPCCARGRKLTTRSMPIRPNGSKTRNSPNDAKRRDRRSTLPRPAMAAGSSPGSTCSTRDAPIIRPAGKAGTAMPG
jgi:hypothetical protein